MLNQTADVDAVLHALADPTRRGIVERLGRGPASVSELAAPLSMSLPAVVQHLHVLEASGVVSTQKIGRVRTCRLELKRLETVQDWIADRRRGWERSLDRLGDYLAAQPDELNSPDATDQPTAGTSSTPAPSAPAPSAPAPSTRERRNQS